MSKDLNISMVSDSAAATDAVSSSSSISGIEEEMEAEQDDEDEEDEEEEEEEENIVNIAQIGTDSVSLLEPVLISGSGSATNTTTTTVEIAATPTLHRYQRHRKRGSSRTTKRSGLSSSAFNYRHPNNNKEHRARRSGASNLFSSSRSSFTKQASPANILAAIGAPFVKMVRRLFGSSSALSSSSSRHHHSRDNIDHHHHKSANHLGGSISNSIESLISDSNYESGGATSPHSSATTSTTSFSSFFGVRRILFLLLSRCFQPNNFRLFHLLLIVFFFLFFVIQFKSGPLSSTFSSSSSSSSSAAAAALPGAQLPSNSHLLLPSSSPPSVPLSSSHFSKLLLQHLQGQQQPNVDQNVSSLIPDSSPPPPPPPTPSTGDNLTNSSDVRIVSPQPNQSTTPSSSSSSSDSNSSDTTASATTEGAAVSVNGTAAGALKPCPLVPSNLVGQLKVLTTVPSIESLEQMLPDVEIGGRYRPHQCVSRHRVAIVIPYRDRLDHLLTFLLNMHPMLMRQNVDYGIYVVEQAGKDRFNRAKLMNIGFLEAMKQYQYDCFIFHDIDLIPEDDRNLYTCPEQPRHMSVAVDKFHYRLPYKDIFGGVSALTRQQFEHVNGFSNEFWGWGGEDDDMSNRIRHYGYTISRYPPQIARYKMLKHMQDKPNADRYKKLYNGWRRYKSDGINSVKYQLIDITFKKLYTSILVDLFPPKFPPSPKTKKRRRTRF